MVHSARTIANDQSARVRVRCVGFLNVWIPEKGELIKGIKVHVPLLLQLQVFSISDLFNMHIDIASNFSKYRRNNRQVSCRNLLYVLKILRLKNLKNESTFLCTLQEVFLCTLYTHQSNLHAALFHTISSILKMHDFCDTHGPYNMHYIIW